MGKAVVDHRSPGRFALTQAIALRASVLDCARPLALWSGPSNVRPCRMMRYVFYRNALNRIHAVGPASRLSLTLNFRLGMRVLHTTSHPLKSESIF